MNEQGEIMHLNKRELTLDGVEENDEAVLAEVTGGGGVLKVLQNGYYKTGDTFNFAPPSGCSKPLAVKPISGPLSTVVIEKPDKLLLSYVGMSRDGQVAVTRVDLKKP